MPFTIGLRKDVLPATATTPFAVAPRAELKRLANMAARAAVVGIRTQDAAFAVALHGALDASVETGPADALAEFKRTWVRATEAATPAVVEVVLQIGTVTATTRLAEVAAVVAAGSAIRIGMQIAACAVASRGGTTTVVATSSA